MVYRIGPDTKWWKTPRKSHQHPYSDRERPLYCFRMAAPETIRDESARLADQVLQFVSQQLGLPGVRLRWFVPDPAHLTCCRDVLPSYDWRATEDSTDVFKFPYDPTGYTPRSRPNEVWIKDGLSELELIGTVTHELKHVHQKNSGNARFECDYLLAELDAYTFSTSATEEFLRTRNDASDSDIRKIRDFGEVALRDLAKEVLRSGLSPEYFRDRLPDELRS